MSNPTPLEIIAALSIDEIDASIEELNGQINALRELRKVAARRQGKPEGNGRSRSATATLGGATSGKGSSADVIAKAESVLRSQGPMPFQHLLVDCGEGVSMGSLRLALGKNPDRFRKLDDGNWSLVD